MGLAYSRAMAYLLRSPTTPNAFGCVIDLVRSSYQWRLPLGTLHTPLLKICLHLLRMVYFYPSPSLNRTISAVGGVEELDSHCSIFNFSAVNMGAKDPVSFWTLGHPNASEPRHCMATVPQHPSTTAVTNLSQRL